MSMPKDLRQIGKRTLAKAPLIELGGRQRNGLIPNKKPFDVLAEGLISQQSRGNKTAIELFIAGVRGWEAGLWRRMDDGKSKQD